MAATDIGQLSVGQLAVARQVFDLATSVMSNLSYSQADTEDAVLGALTTVNDESTFKNRTNNGAYAGASASSVWAWYGGRSSYQAHMRLSFTYAPDSGDGGAETTKDSMGLFQQREMYGYAGLGRSPHPDAPRRLMDPDWTVQVFLTGVPGQPSVVKYWLGAPSALRDRDDLSIAKRCQWVQGSEFPDGLNYLESVRVARQLIQRFGGVPTNPGQSSTGSYVDQLLRRN
jgi:hypothetical protein